MKRAARDEPLDARGGVLDHRDEVRAAVRRVVERREHVRRHAARGVRPLAGVGVLLLVDVVCERLLEGSSRGCVRQGSDSCIRLVVPGPRRSHHGAVTLT